LRLALSSLSGADQVDLQPLFRPTEDFLIIPAFQILFQGRRRVQIDPAPPGHPRHQEVLLVGHAVVLVIYNLAIAVKRETIFYVAADAKDGDGPVAGAIEASLTARGRAEYERSNR
jgi:hypothetical protein